ncbi:MAG: aspartyl protease family protein [Prosthecobacter sp.]
MLPRCLALLLFCAVLPLHGKDPQPITSELTGALRTSGLPAGAGTAVLPLEATIFGALTVEVNIDGTTVQLVLDMGAASTVLSPETARKVGLLSTGKSESVISAAGERVDGQRALAKRISLGNAWTENEPVFVAGMIPGVNGLLGVGTLADWDVRIDPATKKLSLFPMGQAPPLEGETVLPLSCQMLNPQTGTSKRQGFHPMGLTVPLRVGTHELPATPDTGYGGIFVLPSVLMEKLAPEALKDALPGLVSGFSISGKMVSRQAKLPEITFGPDTLRDVATDVIATPPNKTSAGKGLIGLNLLRHYVMTFRFSAGELRLKPLGTVQEITQTSTAGINMNLDYKILSVMPDGPADKAGLRAGDEVLEIEGNPLKTMTPEKFAALKRLPPGTAVKVRYRRGELSPVEASLVLVKK